MPDKLTNSFGRPVADDQNTVTAGSDGPALMQDTHLLDKLAHFDRERIPERVVHAKGAGAYGYFEVTGDVSQYTKAAFLSEVGKRTDLFVRFSTVGGEKGSADSERDPRGFAVKFYTEDGNYEMVGNNTPVFFIRDPLKFPDFIHTQKRNPATNLKDPDMFWDFLSLTPESLHQVTILFSDRGTPKSYRYMNGYTSHTYLWYTDADRYWIKLHFKTDQGNKTLTGPEAAALASTNPDQATGDLYGAIVDSDYPSWTVNVQIMDEADAAAYRYDPFDITKVWPHADYPLIPFGKMVLDRNPENYFAEVEQAAFSPGSFVPGVAASPDKMLQGRLFSYPDTHRHRLGTNYGLIPVNQAKGTTARSYERDGSMRTDGNGGGGPNYYPNTFGGPVPDSGAAEPGVAVTGEAGRFEYTHANDDYEQPRSLFADVMDDTDRDHLISNIAGHLGGAQGRLQLRQAALFYRVHPDFGTRVAEAIGIDTSEVARLAALTQQELVAATLQ
jgi:catalase